MEMLRTEGEIALQHVKLTVVGSSPDPQGPCSQGRLTMVSTNVVSGTVKGTAIALAAATDIDPTQQRPHATSPAVMTTDYQASRRHVVEGSVLRLHLCLTEVRGPLTAK
jgi:hypothetical protein